MEMLAERNPRMIRVFKAFLEVDSSSAIKDLLIAQSVVFVLVVARKGETEGEDRKARIVVYN